MKAEEAYKLSDNNRVNYLSISFEYTIEEAIEKIDKIILSYTI